MLKFQSLRRMLLFRIMRALKINTEFYTKPLHKLSKKCYSFFFSNAYQRCSLPTKYLSEVELLIRAGEFVAWVYVASFNPLRRTISLTVLRRISILWISRSSVSVIYQNYTLFGFIVNVLVFAIS